MNIMPRRAFTLIELLVVIAVIGLLATIAVVALENSRIQARNANRIANIKQLINTFNLGLTDSGSYPDSGLGCGGGGGFVCISASCLGDWAPCTGDETAAVDSLFSKYLAGKPVDPSAGTRSRGGFMYNSHYPLTTVPSGIVIPAGAVIEYELEKPITTCQLGQLYSNSPSFTECIVSLDNP